MFFFFFSSRRRHTRSTRDWSSDVCSSDLTGVGWHTFRHTLGTMLAEMGEHQLTIRDYLRHANLHVTNKYLQATSKSKRLAQDKLDAILPVDFLRMTQPPKTVPHRM